MRSLPQSLPPAVQAFYGSGILAIAVDFEDVKQEFEVHYPIAGRLVVSAEDSADAEREARNEASGRTQGDEDGSRWTQFRQCIVD